VRRRNSQRRRRNDNERSIKLIVNALLQKGKRNLLKKRSLSCENIRTKWRKKKRRRNLLRLKKIKSRRRLKEERGNNS
jgi:hypothetical protein